MTSKTLLTGGCVLTLGAKTSNHRRADVLIEGSAISEVGQGLRARDAEHVDATDTIVMPGFVDTHRHAWTSLFRNVGDPPSGDDARAPGATIGSEFGPDDVYAATLIGLLGAVEAGITTVVDWSPITADQGLADAALRAHADSGLRTVFVHAPGRGPEGPAGSNRGFVQHLVAAAGPSTGVALGSLLSGATDLDRVAEEWALARELGLRIHAHAGPGRTSPGAISAAATRGLLGDDVTLVHRSGLDDADADALAASGAAVSMSPVAEMAGGRGSPPIQRLIDRDIRPGLGVDDERISPGDLFAQMRAAISLQHATVFDLKLAGKAGVPRLLSTRDVIRYATVDGARVAGLAGVTGSIEPGRQADILVLRTDRPNVFPINDPIGAVVWGMDTSNVDWVFVAGTPVVRGGALQADVERARTLASKARERVVTPTGLVIGTAAGGER
ncbi:MAG TPA: amidohydrolase family protein [Actinomycetota bacterium]|nr:amidohydrolase family protein [Actinomycetota bacterium]